MIQIYSGLDNDFINKHSLSHDECIALIYIREKCRDPKTPRAVATIDGRNYYIMPQYSDWVTDIGIYRNEKGDRISEATFQNSVCKLIVKGLIDRRFICPKGIKTACISIDPSWFIDEPLPNDPEILQEFALSLNSIVNSIESAEVLAAKKEYLKQRLETKKAKKPKVPTVIKPVTVNKPVRIIEDNEHFTKIDMYPLSDEFLSYHDFDIIDGIILKDLAEWSKSMPHGATPYSGRSIDGKMQYLPNFDQTRRSVCYGNNNAFTENDYQNRLKKVAKKLGFSLLNVTSPVTDANGNGVYEEVYMVDGDPVYKGRPIWIDGKLCDNGRPVLKTVTWVCFDTAIEWMSVQRNPGWLGVDYLKKTGETVKVHDELWEHWEGGSIPDGIWQESQDKTVRWRTYNSLDEFVRDDDWRAWVEDMKSDEPLLYLMENMPSEDVENLVNFGRKYPKGKKPKERKAKKAKQKKAS